MTERLRPRLFLVPGLIFFWLYCYAALNLPAWGEYRGPYGDVISRSPCMSVTRPNGQRDQL